MNLFDTEPPSPSGAYYTHLVSFYLPFPGRFTKELVDEFWAETVQRMKSFDHNGYYRGTSFIHEEDKPTKAVRVEYWLHSISWFPEVPHRADVPWTTSVRPLNCRGPKDCPSIPRGISPQLSISDQEDAAECMRHHNFTAKAGVCRLPGSGRPKGAKDRRPRKRRITT